LRDVLGRSPTFPAWDVIGETFMEKNEADEQVVLNSVTSGSQELLEFGMLRLPDGYLMSRKEAEQYARAFGCPIATSTLAKIYCISSSGPPVIHFGRKVRYRVADFRSWLLGRLSAPRRFSSHPREMG
jgi:hypothetical protein